MFIAMINKWAVQKYSAIKEFPKELKNYLLVAVVNMTVIQFDISSFPLELTSVNLAAIAGFFKLS